MPQTNENVFLLAKALQETLKGIEDPITSEIEALKERLEIRMGKVEIEMAQLRKAVDTMCHALQSQVDQHRKEVLEGFTQTQKRLSQLKG